MKTNFLYDCPCPACKAVLKAPLHYLGQTVKCASCQQDFIAAGADEPVEKTLAPGTPPTPAKKKDPGCMGCLFAFIVFTALGIIIAATSDHETPEERSERLREQRFNDAIERERYRNYEENIKPYVTP